MKNRLKRMLFVLNKSHSIKEKKVLAAQTLFGAPVFIETGTYLGEMVSAVRSKFSEIHSIELSITLAQEAADHFKAHSHIHIHQGDSGHILKNILTNVNLPAVFWLDAHYSAGTTAKSDSFGDTPILEELRSILSVWNERSVILIDDARLFVGADGYPTIDTVEALVSAENKKLTCFVDSDIIHIL